MKSLQDIQNKELQSRNQNKGVDNGYSTTNQNPKNNGS